LFDKSEKEIKKKWKGECTQPLVSICCATFNQESYIEEAIDSFLMQVTDFPFEIVVHDDASTDCTSDILKQYKSRFPSIIRLILQTENQYQKGKRVMPIAVSQAIGEYVALCEGDDYWISENKLQYQLTFMQDLSDVNLCFHPAVVDNGGSRKVKMINNYSDKEKIYPVDMFIRNGGGFCPTSSLFIKREVFVNMPSWFYVAPAGDTYFQIMGAEKGGALYLPEAMSCYREQASGSVSLAAKQYSLDKVLSYLDKDDYAMESLNRHFNGKYKHFVAYRRAEFCRNFSSSFLSRGRYEDFHKLIERSWAISPNINHMQLLMYKLRNNVKLLTFIQLLRAKLRGFSFMGGKS
jgi:glycosyltransferase involved in cell wall biosynthesis